jgi:2-dehydro-3-deoxyphosphooctonate aldolase (KDO 8-P synthase)
MKPLILIAGPCAIEDDQLPFEIARRVKEIADKYGMRYVFKGSYTKANRSRLDSFTGIGDETALQVLRAVGNAYGIETITDIHESHEAEMAAQYVDHLQIPAFLCRQTRLLHAAGATGKGVHIKKGQFLSPEAMGFAVEKARKGGANEVWIAERGTTFGYNDLMVDATSIHRMKAHGVPVIMDCTHSVQKPNQTSGVTGGDPSLIETIALHAVASGADGLFLEVHPAPHTAQSDPYTMLQLDRLEGILEKCMKVRTALQS